MKNIILFVSIFLLYACDSKKNNNSSVDKHKIAIVIHGGAGDFDRTNLTDEQKSVYISTLRQAVTRGYKILKAKGSGIDAVEKTIVILENSPLFNAGKGAVLTNMGKNELDASIMNGKTLEAGAVAGITNVKNPISLSRKVMEYSKHVFLSGLGAETFAKEQGLEIVDPSYFYTERRMDQLKEKQKHTQITTVSPLSADYKYGTVGCVALDCDGNIVAGTSTGGITNKRWGRIGDSPVIGAGTYANNKTCGVSSTGTGEYFIRGVVAYDISALMEYKNMSLKEAAKKVIQNKLTKIGGDGGIIAIDHKGNITKEFNTSGMFRASVDTEGNVEVDIF